MNTAQTTAARLLETSPIQDHRKLSDRVFESLRDGIINGRLKAGQWLRQETLAQELGVSQMPVREALERLVAEGLAVRIPYRGVQVVEFSAADIVDICTTRLLLEGLAARFAALVIDEATLARLRANLDEAERCLTQEDMPRRRELNDAFHLEIARASGRRYLLRLIQTLWGWFPTVLLYEGMVRQSDLLPARLERERQEHRAILRALEQHDPEQAEAETRRHIRNLSQELTEVLGISGDAVEPLRHL